MNLAQAIGDNFRIDKSRCPGTPSLITPPFVEWYPCDDQNHNGRPTCMPAKGTALHAIYTQIEAHPGIHSSEITEALGMERKNVGIHLCDLRNRGLIESSGRHRDPNWAVRVE